MAGLDKSKLDAWAEETKRNTTGFFKDSQQAHAIERLVDSIASLMIEGGEDIRKDIERAIDENNRKLTERLS